VPAPPPVPGSSASGLPSVGPSTRPDVSSKGLVPASRKALLAAHQMGLSLVSGYRPGDPHDHGTGHAIDVSNSSAPSAEMQAYADRMRGAQGVKYVIFNHQIASAASGWKWRPYEPSADEVAQYGATTAAHEDEVHVSVA
jgi:hypothetical protein